MIGYEQHMYQEEDKAPVTDAVQSKVQSELLVCINDASKGWTDLPDARKEQPNKHETIEPLISEQKLVACRKCKYVELVVIRTTHFHLQQNGKNQHRLERALLAAEAVCSNADESAKGQIGRGVSHQIPTEIQNAQEQQQRQLHH